jgi:hypothetical protein
VPGSVAKSTHAGLPWLRFVRRRVGPRVHFQHDAFAAAEWLRRADRDGSLADFWNPPLDPSERATAAFEGWILGVL